MDKSFGWCEWVLNTEDVGLFHSCVNQILLDIYSAGLMELTWILCDALFILWLFTEEY